MQIKSLRIKSYRSWAIADTASEPAIARMRKLEIYTELKSEGCTTALCLKTIGWSKVTYYRWLKRYQQRGWAAWKTRATARSVPAVCNGQTGTTSIAPAPA